jgi:hypothetical protein
MGPVLVSVAHADDPPRVSAEITAAEVRAARGELSVILARMTSTSRHARALLRDARKRGTEREVSCLDEALSRSDVAYRSAREHAVEALASYARNDVVSARAARARVLGLDEAQRVAARDGARCLPRPAPPAGAQIVPGTFVRVTIDPSIPPERVATGEPNGSLANR